MAGGGKKNKIRLLFPRVGRGREVGKAKDDTSGILSRLGLGRRENPRENMAIKINQRK